MLPTLLIVSAAFGLTLFFGPALLAGIIGAELHEIDWVRRDSHMGVAAFAFTSTTLVTSLWWVMLGLLACKWPGFVRHLFRPFADGFSRRWALALAGAGLLVLALLGGFIALYMGDAFAIFTS